MRFLTLLEISCFPLTRLRNVGIRFERERINVKRIMKSERRPLSVDHFLQEKE